MKHAREKGGPREKAAATAVSAARKFQTAALAWLALPAIQRIGASREGGEMHRRSMDLTRALARLRNPYREEA